MFVPTPSLYQKIQTDIPQFPLITGVHHPISIGSLALFLYVMTGIWVMLLSFVGWGRMVNKLFDMRPLPTSAACLLGIATIIFFGGLLNLLHAIYSGILLGVLAFGLLLFVLLKNYRPTKYRWAHFWHQATPMARTLLIAAILILTFRVIATIRVGLVNSLDDGSAYLLFPQKMLQTHSFAFDPFNERRVTTSLGGGYLLQSLVISIGSLANIAVADRALGLVLLGGILFDLGTLFELSAMQIVWLELLAYLVPQATMNLTFIVLPVAMLLGMIWMLWQAITEKTTSAYRYAFFAGLIGGATIALKSTYLPCVGAFFIVLLTMHSTQKRLRHAFVLPLLAGLGAFVLLFAWMAAMKATSGTYLFPVLGRGVDYSSYGLVLPRHMLQSGRTIFKIFLQGTALLVLACIQLCAGVVDKRMRFSVTILIATAIAITALNYKSGGDWIWRYNFPQFFSAILIYYIVTAATARNQTKHGAIPLSLCISIFSLVAMIFYYDVEGTRITPFRQVRMEWNDYRSSLRASLTELSLGSPQVQAEYLAVESSLPPYGVTLVNTAYPFLFNYRDHNILVVDWPGAASPSPGWPIGRNSNDLVEYLRENSIRYLVYDSAYTSWVNAVACNSLEHPQRYSSELYSLFWMTVLANHQLGQLPARYKLIYDDKNISIVDLDNPLPGGYKEETIWTLNMDERKICSLIGGASLSFHSTDHANNVLASDPRPNK